MIRSYKGISPKIGKDVFIDESAVVIGDIEIGDNSSVWCNVSMRGDVNYIRIGNKTSIQDNSVVHVTHDTHPTIIGNNVTVGHSVTLHGCVIHDYCLIGIGSIVLDGAEVGENSIIAAGAVVSPNAKIPPNSMVMGIPGRVKREITEAEFKHLRESAENYVVYSNEYLKAEK
ncbi:MAG: gamma carbonic anhydrase family protein [Nitrospinae bacterium]|nr:gamma carbonic anhydrase family protein [Nitrospinota bacterium]